MSAPTTPREVVARALLDGFPGAAHWDDQWPGVRKAKLIDADAILAALAAAGFAVRSDAEVAAMLAQAMREGIEAARQVIHAAHDVEGACLETVGMIERAVARTLLPAPDAALAEDVQAWTEGGTHE